jgi:aquaporin Z
MTKMNKYMAEFLGTLFFLYVILAVVSRSTNPMFDAIPVGIGLAIPIMVFGAVSGANFNPAVSVMMVARGTLPSSDLLPYIVAQIAGGLVALELHKRVKM